jgi:hypothetical protein
VLEGAGGSPGNCLIIRKSATVSDGQTEAQSPTAQRAVSPKPWEAAGVPQSTARLRAKKLSNNTDSCSVSAEPSNTIDVVADVGLAPPPDRRSGAYHRPIEGRAW